MELVFHILSLHKAKKPSKAFLKRDNDSLVEANKALQAEVDALRLLVKGSA